jgi:3-hydroxyisobutyrate dehydrogenase-like beta-hydroxyacid dehydrogenase
MNVGFIGVGVMGGHMARHILEGGYNLHVHDIRKEVARPLLDKGAKWVDTPKSVAQVCEVVLLSLPGPPEVEQVVFGKNGLSYGWKKGDICIDTTTNSPVTIRSIAERASAAGVDVLDAPVTGGVPAAEAGKLNFLVGGKAATLDKVRDILLKAGKNIFHVGDSGCGDIAKLVNNMTAFANLQVDVEAILMGVKAGINPKTLIDVIKASTGYNSSLELYNMSVPKGNFEPGFRLALAAKDIKLALELGKKYDVPLPIASAVAQQLFDAQAQGLGEKGNQAIAMKLENENGLKIRF